MLAKINSTITEIKKVKWKSKEETFNLTLQVIGVSLFVGVFIMILDFLFKNLLGTII
jgi:preprotein translocase SecE subunit